MPTEVFQKRSDPSQRGLHVMYSVSLVIQAKLKAPIPLDAHVTIAIFPSSLFTVENSKAVRFKAVSCNKCD